MFTMIESLEPRKMLAGASIGQYPEAVSTLSPGQPFTTTLDQLQAMAGRKEMAEMVTAALWQAGPQHRESHIRGQVMIMSPRSI